MGGLLACVRAHASVRERPGVSPVHAPPEPCRPAPDAPAPFAVPPREPGRGGDPPGPRGSGEEPGSEGAAPRRRGARKPPEDPHRAALDQALGLISRRARTRKELTTAWTRRELPVEAQESALQKLESWGYLDDARFALDRARSLFRSGRVGDRAVVEKLRQHGLPEAEARQAAVAAAAELQVDPARDAQALLERRGLTGKLQPKDRARAWRLLLSRGFSGEAAARALGVAALYPEEGDD